MSSIQTSRPLAAGPDPSWARWAERRWVGVLLYCALAAFALYPIFSVTVPPLVDYPNHLARMHILANWQNIPALQTNYVADWKLHPNMAMELIVPQLARFMSIYMAGKVFIGLTLLLLVGGTMTLRKVLVGRVGLWSVLTFLLLYNYVLFWGFLDYLFTASLALFAFSGWISMRSRGVLLRMVVFSAVSFGLFVGHLFGLFVYGLLVLGYELWWTREHRPRGREFIGAWCVNGVPFVIPAALFTYWTVSNATAVPALNEYGSLGERFAALISPVHIGQPWIDIPTAVFLAIVFAMCRSNKFVGFAPELKIPVLLLAAVAVAMPHYLSGVWGTHFRIPPILACVLVAGVRVAPEAARFVAKIAALAIALFILRTGIIAQGWTDMDRKFMEFRAASAAVDPGAKLLVIQDEDDLPPGRIAVYGMQFWNLGALAVIERSAFVPILFTGHIALNVSPAMRHLDTPVGTPIPRSFLQEYANPETSKFPLGHQFSRYIRIYWTAWPDNFDYALSIRFRNEINPDPKHLSPVERGSFFDIYRVLRPGARP